MAGDKITHDKITLVEKNMIHALLELMQEYPFYEISIKQIVLTAKVARCTFYRRYKNKEELLYRCCELIMQDFARALMPNKFETFYETAIVYFSFLKNHQDFIKLLRDSKLLHVFSQSHDDLIFSVSKKVKFDNPDLDAHSLSSKIRYNFFFGVNGLWGMANRWLMYGCKESPEELAQYVIGYFVETYESEPHCQYYDRYKKYPYEPCFIKHGYE